MVANELQALLDQVESALGRGDLPELMRLTALMEEAVHSFDPAADRQRSRQMADQARRVAARLDAARRGVQSARRRLSDIRAACELRTYDSKGHAQNLSALRSPTPHRF